VSGPAPASYLVAAGVSKHFGLLVQRIEHQGGVDLVERRQARQRRRHD
jgi:hypothetical protein